MKNLTQCLLVLSLTVTSVAAQASDTSVTFKGHAVTGANRYLGQPVQDYGPPLNTFGFYNLGVYNPGGNEPIVIDGNTAEDAVLATAVDPHYMLATGLPFSLVDESRNNVKLRDVGINVSADGETRMTLPSTLAVDPLIPNQAESMGEITLKDWLAAKGSAKFRCSDKGNSVSIKVKNLIPNRLYTVWGLFQSAEGKFKPTTLGGTPNAIATDKNGNGTFKRELGFCATEETQSGARLIAMDIIYHSDHQVYAGVPGLALNGWITGTNTHSHLWFTIKGDFLLNEY